MASSQRIKGITIEIGGDTTNLVKALSAVDRAVKSTQSNLRDINKALQFDPKNSALLADKQNELAKNAELAKSRLEEEKSAYQELENKVNNMPLDLDHAAEIQKTSEEMERLKLQIDLDTVALNEAENALKSFGSVGLQQLKAVGAQMQEVGKKVASVGQDMTTKLTVPIAAGFGVVLKTTADFDSQMSKVQAISTATSEDMEQLSAKAREMGSTSKFSATEAGEAMEYMAMAGWKTEDMLNGVSGIMNLAAASGEELGTTSDIVTDALTAFGMSADESGRLADILASAASNANTNVSMMGESFKYVAPVAGSLGYSAEDVAVALGLMANSGIKADMAGTSLRNMFNRMAKPTKESAMAMERLGLELYDDEGKMYSFRQIMEQLRTSMSNINVPLDEYNAQLDLLDSQLEDGTLTQKKYDAALEELNLQTFGAEGAEKARAAAMLGGTRAMSGLLAIANASEADYQKLTTAIDGSSEAFAKLADGSVVPLSDALASGKEIVEQYSGSAEAMAKTMEDNLTGDITELKSMLQELAISLGELLIPLARDIVGVIQNVVTWLNGLDEGTKKTIMTIAAVVAAAGPILMIIGNIASGIGAVISVVSTIGTAIGAIMPIIASIGGVLTGTVIPAIAAVAAPVLGIVAAIAAVIAIIVTCVKHWEEIKEVASNVAKILAEKWEEFKTKITEIWNSVLSSITNTVNNIKTSVSNAWQNILTTVTNKVTTLKNNAVNAFNNLKNSIINVGNNIKSSITNAWSNIVSTVTNKITNLKNNAVNVFNNMGNGIANVISNIRNTIVNGFQNAISYITSLPSRAFGWGRDIIGGIVDGINNAFSWLTDAVSNIADTIASYIHFSEPDKGALSNFHTYMPDMMRQLAQGIEKGIPQVEDAMNTMTNSMTPTMGGTNATNTTNNNTNTVSVNVYGAQGQDINELAQIIEQTITDNVVRRGVAFA